MRSKKFEPKIRFQTQAVVRINTRSSTHEQHMKVMKHHENMEISTIHETPTNNETMKQVNKIKNHEHYEHYDFP